jgi:hypothetical protein
MKELHNLYASPTIILLIKSKGMRWAGHVARMREMRNAYCIFVRKLERKRQLRRPRRKCEDNIKKELREIRWDVVYWMHLAQDRDRWQVFLNTVINLRVP